MKQTLSIVIPCLNEEENIIRCLNSIAESTYPKHLLEIIIIDGLSQDQRRRAFAKIDAVMGLQH